eukprot:7656460-Alexandrium_andersonii.AAC.1
MAKVASKPCACTNWTDPGTVAAGDALEGRGVEPASPVLGVTSAGGALTGGAAAAGPAPAVA